MLRPHGADCFHAPTYGLSQWRVVLHTRKSKIDCEKPAEGVVIFIGWVGNLQFRSALQCVFDYCKQCGSEGYRPMIYEIIKDLRYEIVYIALGLLQFAFSVRCIVSAFTFFRRMSVRRSYWLHSFLGYVWLFKRTEEIAQFSTNGVGLHSRDLIAKKLVFSASIDISIWEQIHSAERRKHVEFSPRGKFESKRFPFKFKF